MTEAQKLIDGVIVKDQNLVLNARGWLMEVQRRDEEMHPGFGQAYVTATFPGVIKAWFRHTKQIDQICPVKGQVTLVLYDDRPKSATLELINIIVLSDRKPKLVQIPPGVWHGFRADGVAEAVLLHLNDSTYDFASPDEIRLPPDSERIPYQWI